MVKIIGKKEVETSINLTPTTAPTAAKGVVYYDSASDKLKVSTDGSTFVDVASGTIATGSDYIPYLYTGSTSDKYWLLPFTSTSWTTALRQTANGGTTWSAAPTDLSAGSYFGIKGLGSSTNAVVALNNSNGTRRTADACATAWAATVTITNMSSFDDIDSFGTQSYVICGTASTSRSIYYSTDNGATWTVCATGPTNRVNCISMFNSTTGFCKDNSTNRIWKTTDGGVNWTDTTYTTEGQVCKALSANTCLFIRGRAHGIANGFQIYYFDGAANATQISNTGWNNSTLTTDVVKATNGNYYFMTIDHNQDASAFRMSSVSLWKSSNGQNWSYKMAGYIYENGPGTLMDNGVIYKGILTEYAANKLLLIHGTGNIMKVDNI